MVVVLLKVGVCQVPAWTASGVTGCRNKRMCPITQKGFSLHESTVVLYNELVCLSRCQCFCFWQIWSSVLGAMDVGGRAVCVQLGTPCGCLLHTQLLESSLLQIMCYKYYQWVSYFFPFFKKKLNMYVNIVCLCFSGLPFAWSLKNVSKLLQYEPSFNFKRDVPISIFI